LQQLDLPTDTELPEERFRSLQQLDLPTDTELPEERFRSLQQLDLPADAARPLPAVAASTVHDGALHGTAAMPAAVGAAALPDRAANMPASEPAADVPPSDASAAMPAAVGAAELPDRGRVSVDRLPVDSLSARRTGRRTRGGSRSHKRHMRDCDRLPDAAADLRNRAAVALWPVPDAATALRDGLHSVPDAGVSDALAPVPDASV
jgi:hypothetical protein